MKYFLIAGEASGDLHASNLMAALKKKRPGGGFPFLRGRFDAGCRRHIGKALQGNGFYGFYSRIAQPANNPE